MEFPLLEKEKQNRRWETELRREKPTQIEFRGAGLKRVDERHGGGGICGVLK